MAAMPPSWRSYRERSGGLGPWASLACPGAEKLFSTSESANESLLAAIRRCGARRASVTGPNPRTRRRKSSVDPNGRICRCSINCFTRLGPTWGNASRTLAGAVLGSMTSTGTTRQVRWRPVPRESLATRRATPKMSTTKASNTRALAGQVHETTVQTPPRVSVCSSRGCPADLDIRFVTLNAGGS
jgi:hypothetical protein